MGSHLVVWITDYLTGRPQYVQLEDCRSDTMVSSTGVPQESVLSGPVHSVHVRFPVNLQFLDDTAILGYIWGGQEEEYRTLIQTLHGATPTICI